MPSDPFFDVEIIQDGGPVDTTISDPIFDVDVIQPGPPIDTDISEPFFDVEVFTSGQVQDVMVLAGPSGPPGPAGLPAPGAYYAEHSFASAATTWTISLPGDVSSYATNVDTVTFGGDEIEGAVTRPDISTIQVDWYYPTAGIARIYR